MNGIIDVGGGQRAVFACGVLDYLLDHQIYSDYFMGVSAGAANGVSYVARQARRNLEFYTKYNFSPRAIGFLAKLKTGSFVDLDYIYGKLSSSKGKMPVDYETFFSSPADFRCVATDLETGEAVYFGKDRMKKDDYRVVSASSCTPEACRPYLLGGRKYFDGYVSDPIPAEKAIADGCEKLVIILTLPKDHFRSGRGDAKMAEKMKQYPAISEKLARSAKIYNEKLGKCLELEKEGKALILYPKNTHLKVLEKDKKRIEALYKEGYAAGEAAKEFLK